MKAPRIVIELSDESLAYFFWTGDLEPGTVVTLDGQFEVVEVVQ